MPGRAHLKQWSMMTDFERAMIHLRELQPISAEELRTLEQGVLKLADGVDSRAAQIAQDIYNAAATSNVSPQTVLDALIEVTERS